MESYLNPQNLIQSYCETHYCVAAILDLLSMCVRDKK